MKHLFLFRNKKGEPTISHLPVITNKRGFYGNPIKRDRKRLADAGGWINLSTTIDDPRYGWAEKILKDFGI